jgi:hypothetical protein
VWINHGVVARAEVAGVLPTSRGNAVASVAADVAHLVAHLLLPVVGASPRARPLAVYLWSLQEGSRPLHLHLLHQLWMGRRRSSSSRSIDMEEEEDEQEEEAWRHCSCRRRDEEAIVGLGLGAGGGHGWI